MKLKNKTIIITGSGKGLGAGFAKGVALEGANVICADIDEAEVQAVAASIKDSGGDALAVACDVSDSDQLETLVQTTIDHYGRIDGLINNAGINFVKPFTEITPSEWKRVISVDLEGTFFLTQLCVREMLKQGDGGSIVQIGSVHTKAALPGAAPYDAAKHGVVGMSMAAAVELAPQRIRINVLSPGLCNTTIWKDIIAAAPNKEECLKHWNANIPAERLIEPEELARCCVFLLCDDSSCITGTNILADNGMTSLLLSREPYAAGTISTDE